jgi:3-hydroxyisobutyrate dehydrogenase-like beta-hydroxyacid dehydrogenase
VKEQKSVGFVGLGNMGHGIASNLLKAGYTLRVYNRTREKAKHLVERGAILVNQPSDVIESGGIVFTMLSEDSVLLEIAECDEHFVKKLGPNGIHVSMSTVSPDTSRHLSAHHSQSGVKYLAAPVVGRPDRAAAGTLFILLAGSSEAKQIVSPFLEKISQRVFDFGDLPWSSNIVKLALNFNIAAAIEAMAESFTLAEKNGISRAKMAELLSETLFSSVVYKGYGDHIAHHSYEPAGFQLTLGWKDIRLVLQTAAESSTPMPIASLLRDRLLSAISKGRGDLDWSALALGASDDAGLGK